MLSPTGCATRRARMLRRLETAQWDALVTANPRTIYRLSGEYIPADQPVLYALRANGDQLFVRAEAYTIDRSINFPGADVARQASAEWSSWLPRNATLALEFVGLPAPMAAAVGSLVDAAPEPADTILLSERRSKEEDEIDEIRACLRLHAVAYDAARRTMAPGLTELDVFEAMSTAVTRALGTSFFFTGDFACGLRSVRAGGPPTRRTIEAGDLYILDLFPTIHYYFADTCRTFAVSTPTDLQLQACEAVIAAKKHAETLVRPGISTRSVYAEIKRFLDDQPWSEGSFWHHLGHGIGGYGHDEPRIIPGSDEVFVEGDVITLEPGVYTTALQGGIRIEDNYVVRAEGLENLFDYPMGLTA